MKANLGDLSAGTGNPIKVFKHLRSMSSHVGLGLIVTILGFATLAVGIVLGNARVVGAGALTCFVAELL